MNLSSISLACRDDPNGLTAQGIGHKKHPAFDATKKLVAIFTVCPADIRVHYTVRVEKSTNDVGKIEASLGEAGFAFGFVPFELLAAE